MTAATLARQRRGLSLNDAAARLRITARYLRAIELHGGANYALACRLASLYECPALIFLYATQSNTTTNSGGETLPKISPRRSPTTQAKI